MLAPQQTEKRPAIDKTQLLAVLGLMVISIAFVYSATSGGEHTGILGWYRQTFFKQIIWFILGATAAVGVCSVDYHTLTRWSFVAYCVAIFFLLIVLVP